ncbi:MAG: hypothetical protein ACTSV5_03995 [Promethearchaeota archaeon]
MREKDQMDKCSKTAFKITLALFLTIFGFAPLLMNVLATPPSPYDYGRKGYVRHTCIVWFWWVDKFTLYNNLAVNYNNGDGDYIASWITTGSQALVHKTEEWFTYGYSTNIDKSVPIGGYYSWVKFSNEATFETKAGHGDKIMICYAWNKIISAFQFTHGESFTQQQGLFMWMTTGNNAW